jgi:hypothetical protein
MDDVAKTEASGKILASRAQAMEALDCGHSYLNDLMKSGELEAVRDGRRTKITWDSIRRRAASLPRIKADKQRARAP